VTQESAQGLVAKVAEYCAREESGVRLDVHGGTLLDEAGAKMLSLRPGQLTRADVMAEPESGAAYVALAWEDGKELLLTPMGAAFPPDTVRTGPLPDLPRFVTFRDYLLYRAAAEHPLRDHPDVPPTREMAQALVYCVAILEGARVAGFEVRRELEAVSGLLKEVDRRIQA
jgi:hypothetical protein